jgi:sulfur-oxidizing protein SoxA
VHAAVVAAALLAIGVQPAATAAAASAGGAAAAARAATSTADPAADPAAAAGGRAARAASVAAPPRRSGFDEMTPALQAMQRDDTRNPAMLWVADGERLWNEPATPGGKACAHCHGAAAQSMRGVAARYPAWDERLARPLTLAQRIGQCRQRHQQAAPWPAEAEDALALEAYVALQSRGMPIAPPEDARLAAWRGQGRRLYAQRIGQLDLACHHCHDQRAGLHLGATAIPQGHPTGYPLYRLEWQALGSLARRIRGCMSGVRAEPYAPGADELTAIELHLKQRAAGLAVDAPAVRP